MVKNSNDQTSGSQFQTSDHQINCTMVSLLNMTKCALKNSNDQTSGSHNQTSDQHKICTICMRSKYDILYTSNFAWPDVWYLWPDVWSPVTATNQPKVISFHVKSYNHSSMIFYSNGCNLSLELLTTINRSDLGRINHLLTTTSFYLYLDW